MAKLYPNNWKRWVMEELERVVSMREAGKDWVDISRVLGRSPDAISTMFYTVGNHPTTEQIELARRINAIKDTYNLEDKVVHSATSYVGRRFVKTVDLEHNKSLIEVFTVAEEAITESGLHLVKPESSDYWVSTEALDFFNE